LRKSCGPSLKIAILLGGSSPFSAHKTTDCHPLTCLTTGAHGHTGLAWRAIETSWSVQKVGDLIRRTPQRNRNVQSY
jgi:hypothetical protein